MARRPAFAAVVVGTLALGIGANSAVFTVLESVVLAPLPFDEPERLIRINLFRPDRPEPELRTREFLSVPFIHALRGWPVYRNTAPKAARERVARELAELSNRAVTAQ